MEVVTSFLTDNEGNPSAMRLMCAWSLAISGGVTAALVFGWLHGHTIPIELVYVIALFAIGAFVPKAIQKYAELNIFKKS